MDVLPVKQLGFLTEADCIQIQRQPGFILVDANSHIPLPMRYAGLEITCCDGF